MVLRIGQLLSLALVALALASCGEGETEDYESGLESALTSLATETEISGAANDREAVAQGVRNLASALEEAIAALEDIEPPDEVRETHRSLIEAISELHRAVVPVAEATESGDDAALQASTEELQAVQANFGERLDELGEELRSHGVEVSPLP